MAERGSTGRRQSEIPRHVAIIMDGNGRWARRRGLPRVAGHRAGTENIRRVIEGCVEEGVEVLTLYAFSTENWRRPTKEVQGLLRIIGEVIDRETENLHRNGVQLRHIGQLEGLSETLKQKVRQAIELTRDNERLILNVAFNYGGRDEIVQATRRIVEAGIPPDEITEERFSEYLYTAGCPDPDLIIRTAGEMRLSNFLIWQAAYSEFYATPTFWPDFGKEELHQAIVDYGRRLRKFGQVPEQVQPGS